MKKLIITIVILVFAVSLFAQTGTGWDAIRRKQNFRDSIYFTKDPKLTDGFLHAILNSKPARDSVVMYNGNIIPPLPIGVSPDTILVLYHGGIYYTTGPITSYPDYYVSANGSDDSTGLTPDQAWKTIAKVNGATFTPGTKIYFKRGDTWREQLSPQSGTVDGYITYAAYGTGNKPLLLGSVEKDSLDDWTDTGGNIWKCHTTTGVIFSDNFNDNSVNTSSWINNYTANITESGGTLNFSTTLTANYFSIVTMNNHSLVNSSITIKVVNAGNQSLTHYGAYPLGLVLNGSNNLIWGIQGNILYAYKTVSGVSSTVASVAYNSAVHKYLRIREDGGTTYFDYSANDTTYTNFTSLANPFSLTSLALLLQVGTWDTEAITTTMIVDDLKWNGILNIDVANIIFNNEASCGVKQMSVSPTLDGQGEFWYDFTDAYLYLYSVGNPATFYTNIELALSLPICDINNKNYIIFQNLDFRYGNYAIQGYTTHHINVLDCQMSYIGGGDMLSDYTIRAGNGIEFYNNAHDNLVERCHISNCYDAGLTNQGDGSGKAAYNIFYIYNIIEKCEYSTEIYMKGGATSSMHDIRFENNTCVSAGGGWGHNQRPDGVNGAHLMVWTNTATISNIYIKNNIFYNSTESLIHFASAGSVSAYLIDYSDLYQSSGDIGDIAGTTYDALSTWQAASSQDANSIDGDPLFVSPSYFYLQVGSPCIDAGVSVGLVEDYVGNPIIGAPDIGCYEHQ